MIKKYVGSKDSLCGKQAQAPLNHETLTTISTWELAQNVTVCGYFRKYKDACVPLVQIFCEKLVIRADCTWFVHVKITVSNSGLFCRKDYVGLPKLPQIPPLSTKCLWLQSCTIGESVSAEFTLAVPCGEDRISKGF